MVVRLTTDEYAELSAHAVEIGHTVPSYLALTGLRPDGVAPLRVELVPAVVGGCPGRPRYEIVEAAVGEAQDVLDDQSELRW